jgi:hypothetical protein
VSTHAIIVIGAVAGGIGALQVLARGSAARSACRRFRGRAYRARREQWPFSTSRFIEKAVEAEDPAVLGRFLRTHTAIREQRVAGEVVP